MNFFKKTISIFMCFCLCMPSLVAFAESTVAKDATLKMDRVRSLPEEFARAHLPR